MKKKKKRRINKIKVLMCLIFLIAILFLISSKVQGPKDRIKETSASTKETVVSPKEDITINMSVIGDIMCHNTQYQDAYNSSSGTYDFSYVFTDIKKYIENADISIGNLETTFAGKDRNYSGYPTFNTPEILAKNLKDLGIDVLGTANNHSLDKGYKGIASTLDFLDEQNISHMGTYRSEEEQNTIITKDVNGIKFAFLAFTYGTNGITVPSGKEFCINLIDKDLILKQINLAKEQNPDIICVNMHWGIEYQTSPNKEQKDLADFLFENDVDIILGSHPHVLQKMEKRTITTESGKEKDGFVIYSLGNFMSGQVKENTKNSVILNLSITKHSDDRITIDSAKYTPIYMYKSGSSNKKYKILDIKNSISNYENGNRTINSSTYNILKTELNKIIKTVGNEI